MNLVEFPEDKLAFDPTKITAIVGKLSPVPVVSCPEDCPGRWYNEFDCYDVCSIKDHITYTEYSIITLNAKEYTVNRPFHDVLLVITAHLLDNNQNIT